MSSQSHRRQPVSASSISSSIQQLAKEDPDAFVQLYFQTTSLLVELDRAGYEYLMATVLLKTFRESGLFRAMEQLRQKLECADIPGASERLEAIAAWARMIENLASQERLETLLAEHKLASTPEQTGLSRISYLM